MVGWERKEEFQLSSDEEAQTVGMNVIEREKFLAKKYQEKQAKAEEEFLSKHKEENQNLTVQTKKYEQERIMQDQFVLTRRILSEGVFRNNFNIIKNAFVKIRVNEDYRICKILGVQQTDSYVLDPSRKTKDKVYCRLGLNVDAGKRDISGWPIANVSDRPPTADEFQKFAENYDLTAQSFEGIVKKYQHIKKEFSRNMTNNEISDFIKKKTLSNPQKLNNTTIKMQIIKRRDDAIARKDKTAAAEAQRELEQIEDNEFAERMKHVYNKDDLAMWLAKRREASAVSRDTKLIEDDEEEYRSKPYGMECNKPLKKLDDSDILQLFDQKDIKKYKR